ncbi:TonB-linked SusC/RagA family outer membrane protein [Larkinella arboricola]|uniref:TonB-linked SusC/RagA family outer membrane protein n=1 Tax=Larkinella arboricola TaxID=643671 RepID=A0A327WI11_LARAB|nr:TonB-dependent receptor [Larkinella arboricola]RAJ91028.1 TonB-linked SusC/RagA family outer membrane protein [Larkinella arboricola]
MKKIIPARYRNRDCILFRNRWNCFLSVVLGILLSGSVYSQSLTVRGKVTRENGESLPGVTILIKGTLKGVVSDAEGAYQITASKGDMLQFSYIGYNSVQKTVESDQLDVQLTESNINLEEAVVIGYGSLKSTQITSSIAKIKAQDLDQRPVSRIDHALNGKLAGVQVQETSGSPGRGMAVKVRGVGSINNSGSPLYVVDGFPINSGLDNINPNEIESIEVLKDAASAAIYGSRGSNGVVLITTKSGKKGKPVLEFDTYYGLQERFSRVDVLNRDEYIDFAIEERNNTWMLQGGKASDPNSVRSNANYWIDPVWLTDPKSLPDHDWQKLISRVAPVQNYQLSASGSSENTKYYISGNYFNQQGIILGSDYNRLAFRANVETKLSSRVNMGLNLSATSVRKNDSDGDGLQGPVSRSVRVAPIVGLNQQTQLGGFYPYHAAFYLNPIALATQITNETKSRNLRANLYTTVDLAQNLRFRTSFGADFLSDLDQFFKPDNINRGVGHVGTVGTGTRENYLNENTLTYDIQKEKWSLNALAGFTYQEDKFTATSLSKTGFPDDEIPTLNMGTILSAGESSATAWSLMSFLGRVSTSFRDKYLLTASIRRDGSSRFGADNRWGWFPAASVGWRISQEPFMRAVSFIDDLKLRVSYGVAGNNNIGDYAAIGTLSNTNYVLGGSQAVVSGFSPSSFSNRMLGWERSFTFDAGFDLAVFNNRVVIGFDVYRTDTKDLLLNVQIPPITGFSSARMNIGSVRNSGVELELTTRNLTGPFKWTTSFNITHNTNKVTALGPGNAPIYTTRDGFTTITQVGQPIGSYFAFVQDGVFVDQKDFDSHPKYKTQNVGDIKYKDVNGDGKITEDDRTILGNNNPKFFWGMQNSFSYGQFDMMVSMDGQWGNKLLNAAIGQHGQSRGNVDGYWRDRWRSPEQPGNGWVPRAAVTANLTTPSSFWLRSAAYWRVRTISLGYRLPESLLAKTKSISGIRIYGSVDNVFMHDHYNKNPQTGTYSNTNTLAGVDFDATYPLARTYTLGLNVKF